MRSKKKEDLTIEEQNRACEKIGLDKIEIVHRTCLTCGEKFISVSKFNRMCDTCKGSPQVDSLTTYKGGILI